MRSGPPSPKITASRVKSDNDHGGDARNQRGESPWNRSKTASIGPRTFTLRIVHRKYANWRESNVPGDWKTAERFTCVTASFGSGIARNCPASSACGTAAVNFGLEIHVVLAFLVFAIGVSIDQARAILQFFTRLELSRSQADALLNQLASDWEEDFEALCRLVAMAAVLYIDETGWKVGKRACYTWIFTTLSHVVFLCGKGRGGDVLDAILPEGFAGIGVTDNYSAYENRFSKHQKCWAHLLRKIISLMLRFPEKAEYRAFFEELYAIYGEGVRYQKDQRLTAGRGQRVALLQEKIRRLCVEAGQAVSKELPDDRQRFLRLQNELIECLDNLFVFVEHPEVAATNNCSEQQARSEAQARKAARTSKTARGAKRRSIITSVLGSLRRLLPEFTMQSVLEEIGRWCEAGISRFRAELGLPRAGP